MANSQEQNSKFVIEQMKHDLDTLATIAKKISEQAERVGYATGAVKNLNEILKTRSAMLTAFQKAVIAHERQWSK